MGAPPRGGEAEKANLRNIVNDAESQSSNAVDAGNDQVRELLQRNGSLKSELEEERKQLAVLRAEHARELRRRDVEQKRIEAELLDLRGGGGTQPSPQPSVVPPMAHIQQQLLSEVEALRHRDGVPGT